MLSGDKVWGVGCDVQEGGRNFHIGRNSGDWYGEVCIPVARGRCTRGSDAQQITHRRCVVRSQWERRFDCDHVIRLASLIAVGRGLRLRVEAV